MGNSSRRLRYKKVWEIGALSSIGGKRVEVLRLRRLNWLLDDFGDIRVLYYFEHFASSRVTGPRGEGEIGRVPGHFRRRRTCPTVTYIIIFLPAARSPQNTYPALYRHSTKHL